MKSFQIWIDADACPKSIKEVIFKISGRIDCPVTLVANSEMFIPKTPLVKLVKVKKDVDAADHYIASHVSASDIVVTADIPLAALIVEKGALAIDVRGEIYSIDNVQERLSMRDFMKSLRDSGMEVGGPANFDAKDKEKFTNALNKIIDKKMRELKP